MDIEKAKQWCNKARELLGSGYIWYTESSNMHLRNEEAAKELKKLETSNPTAFLRLGSEYKFISKDAKAAVQAQDADQSRRVSAELELLNLDIKKEISGLSPNEKKQRFEKRKSFVNSELERLESVADSDTHRLLKNRFDDVLTECQKNQSFGSSDASLKQIAGDIRTQITDWSNKQKLWDDDRPRRVQIQNSANLLSPDSPHRYRIEQLLKSADDFADRVRDFDLAEKFVAQCENIVIEQKQYETPIRQKISQFQSEDGAFVLLSNEVKNLMDQLFEAFAEEQRKRGRDVPPSNSYHVLGEFGNSFLEVQQVAQGYRQRANAGKLEAWGGYPDAIIQATKTLKEIKQKLQMLLANSSDKQHAVIDLVHNHQAQQLRETILKEWADEKSKAMTALERLAESSSPTSQDYKALSSTFQQILNLHDGAKTPYEPEKLKTLTNEINKAIEKIAERRADLQKEREKVRDKWNELFEKRDVFPESYYDGMSNEYDQLQVYLDSPNPGTVAIGLQKRKDLLKRFEDAIAQPTAIQECAEKFDAIKKQLTTEEKELAQFQSSRLAQHQFLCNELALVVQTEDPSTLLPKLNDLQSALGLSIAQVPPIKSTRNGVESIEEELKPLFASILEAYERLGKDVPDEYKCSYEQVAAKHVMLASKLEDNSKALDHLNRLRELKTNLEILLLSDTEISSQYDGTETKQVAVEKKKRQEQEEQRLAYEKALSDFTKGSYKQLKAIVNPDAITAVNSAFEQSKKHAADKNFAEALRSLRLCDATAKSLLANSMPGRKNESLQGLGKPWGESIAAVNNMTEQLIETIKQICVEIKTVNPTADSVQLLDNIQLLAKVLDGFNATEFEPFVEKILDERRTDSKAQAELALQRVRQRIGVVQSDPLLLKLSSNPFGVKVPRLSLLRALRSFEFALQIVE